MAELSSGFPNQSEWPATDMEAAALRPVITDLLMSIPDKWAEFDFDGLTKLQSNGLFLMTAAGMVERRGWVRSMFANHPICFEARFQATGEGGLGKAMEHVSAVEFGTWGDAWRKWREGETKDHSPFHSQQMKPQEWRLTEQGGFARDELNRANPSAEPNIVFDFVLKRGFYGPGYWLRRAMARAVPLTADERGILDCLLAAGHDLAQLPRPFVGGSGQLLEIRKIDETAVSQAVNLTNWGEGASAFADAFGKLLAPMFETINKTSQAAGAAPEVDDRPDESHSQTPDLQQPESPSLFHGGEIVFLEDRVIFCGVEICNGPRSQSQRKILELLCKRRSDGGFVSYSGAELAERAELKGGESAIAGAIRDLRDVIADRIRQEANILCGRQDVILSGGPGYRLAKGVSVQQVAQSSITDITDKGDEPDVRTDDVRDDDVRDDAAGARRAWILQELAKGRKLKAPDVAEHFGCSVKTAQRDLTALKDEGRVEFVGAPRTGFYRLRQAPQSP